MQSQRSKTFAELSSVSHAELRGEPQRVIHKVMTLADADDCPVDCLVSDKPVSRSHEDPDSAESRAPRGTGHPPPRRRG